MARQVKRGRARICICIVVGSVDEYVSNVGWKTGLDLTDDGDEDVVIMGASDRCLHESQGEADLI